MLAGVILYSMDRGKCRILGTFQHPLQAPSKGENVVIVGTAETAAVMFEYLNDDTPHRVVAFSAERKFITADRCYGLPVVPFEDLPAVYPASKNRIFIAIAVTQLNRIRRRLYRAVKAAGFDCVSYVSSYASAAPDVAIGENVMVQENVTLQYGARIGANTFLGSGTCVGYGSVIGSDCFTGPHATVGDSCSVGPGSFLGAASCLADGCSAGEDCVVGAGAVITEGALSRHIYLGNPARPVARDSFDTFGVTGG
jgi:sugar O-acyltransferase (sialic acid O-acetyltransferase NeuD family)